MRVLHLTIKKKWFDMIINHGKSEEYREIKLYWQKRLYSKPYTHVRFKNGYRGDSPFSTFSLSGIAIGQGRTEWGAPEGTEVFILKLGERID